MNSILDTDLYKFSTSYAYFKLYPKAEGEFVFNDRNQEKWSKEDQKKFTADLKKVSNGCRYIALLKMKKNGASRTSHTFRKTIGNGLQHFHLTRKK